jgi:hypothetical protein
MTKYNPENERLKRDYVTHMRLAQGKQDASVVAALAAIDRFERSTGYRTFKAFHIEQAKAFREKMLNQPGARGQERLSAATVTSTLRSLKALFIWLAERPGYRSRISFSTLSTSIRRRPTHGSLGLVGRRAFRPSISLTRWLQR